MPRISEISGNYSALETAGSIFQKAARFFIIVARTDRSMSISRCMTNCGPGRGPKVEMGAGFPEAFASAPRAQNAALSRHEKSAAPANTQKRLKSTDVVASMWRLFVSCGGAVRLDILISENASGPSANQK